MQLGFRLRSDANGMGWSSNTHDAFLMTYSDTGTTMPSEQLYTSQVQPYFRAPTSLFPCRGG